jgi:hypothetical protein
MMPADSQPNSKNTNRKVPGGREFTTINPPNSQTGSRPGLGRCVKDVPLSRDNMLSEVGNIRSIMIAPSNTNGMIPDDWKLRSSTHLLFKLASDSRNRYMKVVTQSKRIILLLAQKKGKPGQVRQGSKKTRSAGCQMNGKP